MLVFKPAYPRLNRAHPLAQGLVLALVFYEGSGNKVYDLSGRDIHGSLTNMSNPGIATSGWYKHEDGYILSFDNTDDYIDLGTIFSLNTLSKFTYITSYYPKSLGSNFQGYLFNNGVISIDINNGAGNTITFTKKFSTTNLSVNGSVNCITFNTWLNIAYTSLATVNAADTKLYINGILNTYDSTVDGIGTINSDIGNSVLIGTRDLSFFYVLDGFLKYTYIFNKILSLNEIQYIRYNPYAMFRQSRMLYNAIIARGRRTLLGIG